MPGALNKSVDALPVYLADENLNPLGSASAPLRSTAVAATSTASNNQSGTLATSGATVALTIANTARYEVLNPSTSTLWASWGSPSVNGAGSFPINAGGSYGPPDRTAGTLTLLSTAANQNYTVNRFA